MSEDQYGDRYVIRGNDNNFEKLKGIAAEFGRVAVVNHMRFFIRVEDVADVEKLDEKILQAGGKMHEDIRPVYPIWPWPY